MDNWAKTELGNAYDIYRDDEGNLIGQQYPSDTGPLPFWQSARIGQNYTWSN